VKEPVKAEPVEKEVEKEPITEPVKEEVVEEPVKEVEKKIKREKRIVGQKPVSYNETDKPLKEKLISKEKLVAKTTNNPELNIIENKSEEIKSEKDTSLSDTPSFINNKEVINNNLDKEKSAIKSVPKKETSVKHDISKEYVSQPKDELDEVNLDEGLNSFTDKLTSALIVILIIVIIIVFVIFLFKYFGLN
ncbi:MAG: hypothetical protein Q4Q23_08150, partial [Methanobacteriaceae archaeon]|nr:hypothetical protein [Methanobacteriaceae archaeon]